MSKSASRFARKTRTEKVVAGEQPTHKAKFDLVEVVEPSQNNTTCSITLL